VESELEVGQRKPRMRLFQYQQKDRLERASLNKAFFQYQDQDQDLDHLSSWSSLNIELQSFKPTSLDLLCADSDVKL